MDIGQISAWRLFCHLRKLRLFSAQAEEWTSVQFWLQHFHHTPSHLKGSFILTSVELQRSLWINETRGKFQKRILNKSSLPGMGSRHNLTSSCVFSTGSLAITQLKGFSWRFGRSRRSSFGGTAARTDSCSLPRPLCSDRFRRWSVGSSTHPTYPATTQRSHPTGKRPPGTTHSPLSADLSKTSLSEPFLG